MVSERGGGIDKKKYKLLKKALKDQLDLRSNLEVELMSKIQKIEEQTKAFEEMKEQNLTLYSKNAELEDVVTNLKQLNKMNEDGAQTDEEHLKEMMGAQNLLREEMKEKEFFKEQAQHLTQKLISIEEAYNIKEKDINAQIQRKSEEMI